MDFNYYSNLKRIFLVTTFLTVLSFFSLLISVNFLNRSGIKEGAQLELQTADYKDKTEKLNQVVATYSSLIRVEERAKALGFDKAKHVEYIR